MAAVANYIFLSVEAKLGSTSWLEQARLLQPISGPVQKLAEIQAARKIGTNEIHRMHPCSCIGVAQLPRGGSGKAVAHTFGAKRLSKGKAVAYICEFNGPQDYQKCKRMFFSPLHSGKQVEISMSLDSKLVPR